MKPLKGWSDIEGHFFGWIFSTYRARLFLTPAPPHSSWFRMSPRKPAKETWGLNYRHRTMKLIFRRLFQVFIGGSLNSFRPFLSINPFRQIFSLFLTP
jgi:hypothetical protein